MQKRVIAIVFLVIFIVGCGGGPGDNPLDTSAAIEMVRSGTQGVELEFLQDSPPPLIYDLNELVSILEVKNLGNFDLRQDQCFVQITGFDPTIIGGDFNVLQSCAQNLPLLGGKNLYNVQGDVNQLEFTSADITLPDVPDYAPTLKYNVCYNYRTKATPSICIDPLRFQISPDQRACDYRTPVTVRAGQGGPVGVSFVKSEMINGKAIFEINIRNMGMGRVLSPYADLNSCGDISLSRTDFDRVGYAVQLGTGIFGDCKPLDGIVRLHNNNGKILCTFPTPGTSAFTTPLTIDLDYSYWTWYDKQVRIIQTPR
jgi:hypothetical protein